MVWWLPEPWLSGHRFCHFRAYQQGCFYAVEGWDGMGWVKVLWLWLWLLVAGGKVCNPLKTCLLVLFTLIGGLGERGDG